MPAVAAPAARCARSTATATRSQSGTGKSPRRPSPAEGRMRSLTPLRAFPPASVNSGWRIHNFLARSRAETAGPAEAASVSGKTACRGSCSVSDLTVRTDENLNICRVCHRLATGSRHIGNRASFTISSKRRMKYRLQELRTSAIYTLF